MQNEGRTERGERGSEEGGGSEGSEGAREQYQCETVKHDPFHIQALVVSRVSSGYGVETKVGT